MKCVRPERGKIRSMSVRQAEELATIVETSRNLCGKPFDSVVNEIAARVSSLVRYPYCSILLAYPDRQNLTISGAYGLSSRYIDLINQKYTVPPGSGPSGLAFSRGWSFAVDDVFKDPGFTEWRDAAAEEGYTSVVSVPITTSCQKIGSLTCYTPYKHVFSEQEMLWLIAIGRATGSAIQIASFVTSQNEAIARLEEINLLLKQQHQLHKQYEETSDLFTKMVLAGEGPHNLVEALAKTLEKTIIFEDRTLRVVCISHSPTGGVPGTRHERPIPTLQEMIQYPGIRRLFAEMNCHLQPIELPALPEAGAADARIIYPVVLGHEILGYLSVILGDSDLTAASMKIIEYAASAIAFSLIKHHTIVQFNLKRKSDFLHTLLTNKDIPEATLEEEAEEIGGAALIPYRAMCVEVKSAVPLSENEESRVLGFVSDVITANNSLALVKKGKQRLTVLFPESKDKRHFDACEVAERAGKAVRQLAERIYLVIGIGSKKEHFTEFQDSHREAEKVLQLLSGSGPPESDGSPCLYACYDNLGLASLLLQVQDPGGIRSFSWKTLRPIIDYDDKFKSQLLITLKTYLQENCQNQTCSQKLSIHPNTLAYRLRKIEELTGKNLNKLDDLMEMKLALKIMELFPCP